MNGSFEDLIKISNLGVNGLLIFALWKIWAVYQESQKAYVVLLDRCIQTMTNVDRSIAELKDK